MAQLTPVSREVFTVFDIAQAAAVSIDDVRRVVETGEVVAVRGRFVSFAEAVQLIRELRNGGVRPRRLFADPSHSQRSAAVPLAASGALHTGLLAAVALIASLGLNSAPTEAQIKDSVRLVFLSTPGPGGGGGGGGLRQQLPAAKSEIRWTSKLRSPVTVSPSVVRREPEKRVETPPSPLVPEAVPDPVPPAPQPQPTPPVVAPVVSAASDQLDRAGVVTETPTTYPSHGSGAGSGTGTGHGTGSGEGSGAGIGDGSITGIGGGPYRPGAGITPPGLLHEVKPNYTEDGRRRGVEGEVMMEVVVRSDGTVGTVRIIRGLGSGLDSRASDAVRQWRFSPARRYGTPVDVLVEVAVEFRLR